MRDDSDLSERLLAILDSGPRPVTADRAIELANRDGTRAVKVRSRWHHPRRRTALLWVGGVVVLIVALVLGLGPLRTNSGSPPTGPGPDWHQITFGGLRLSVPTSWPVLSMNSWTYCGQVGFFRNSTVILDTGINVDAVICPSSLRQGPIPPVYGILVDPGPNGPLRGTSIGRCQAVNDVKLCPSVNYGGIRLYTIYIPGKSTPVAIEIGMAGGGQIARTILGSARAAASPPPTTSTTTTIDKVGHWTSSRGPSGLLSWHGVVNPEISDSVLGLFMAWDESPPGSPNPETGLARLNRTTGQSESERTFSAGLDDDLTPAAGSLWATTISRSSVVVVRLNPLDLTVTGEWDVPGPEDAGSSLAVAGAGIWVAVGDRLTRISAATGQATTSVLLAGADYSNVATDSTGSVLVISEGVDGKSYLQRRDPITGALLKSSRPIYGSHPPRVSVSGEGVWVSNATGNAGYVERFDTATLSSDPSTEIQGSNGIGAAVYGDTLFVDQTAGGPGRNFCGDPSDGSSLAPLDIGSNDYVIGVGSNYFYTSEDYTSGGENVYELTIPPACQRS
jgi:hypothetical protein